MINLNTESIKNYPFTAIVGQEDMKKALILNIINPSIGGVLIRGEKGTGKSTAVRSIVDLLPRREEVENCILSCDPLDLSKMCEECRSKVNAGERLEAREGKMKVIELPINATEDRVAGTLDIQTAIKRGEKKFEPGILAFANRNILYIDEINLLEDHIVDILLDAAAMGVNNIEREGISYAHPSRFILVGTMNPEEGDIRPQLIDRFGLVVDVIGEKNNENRIEVINRRMRYENDPEAFIKSFERENNELAGKIISAKNILSQVTYGDDILEATVGICIKLDLDGHRGDITAIKTAATIAAFNGRTIVTKEDLAEALKFVIPHRMRKRPFEEGNLDITVIHELLEN
ncbi:ATP-binding protein [Proteiniborus sp. MB09-C3]|uniref:ATP-binding protein n=1 Tax=Proteiniborus sp. MB09-C3 TaxID=3050072 RepID=UPI002553D6A9|nr:ATP-binding protein [Proteiniborus sp. MB09-C3]WIV11797.1 ATP-binding protein [Proteiniborus sp. MB09-C3]